MACTRAGARPPAPGRTSQARVPDGRASPARGCRCRTARCPSPAATAQALPCGTPGQGRGKRRRNTPGSTRSPRPSSGLRFPSAIDASLATEPVTRSDADRCRVGVWGERASGPHRSTLRPPRSGGPQIALAPCGKGLRLKGPSPERYRRVTKEAAWPQSRRATTAQARRAARPRRYRRPPPTCTGVGGETTRADHRQQGRGGHAAVLRSDRRPRRAGRGGDVGAGRARGRARPGPVHRPGGAARVHRRPDRSDPRPEGGDRLDHDRGRALRAALAASAARSRGRARSTGSRRPAIASSWKAWTC